MSAALLISALKEKIGINPFSLSGVLYPLESNGHGGFRENKNTTPAAMEYTNSVRIGFQIKKIRKVEKDEALYFEKRVYFMLSDNLTPVDIRLEFDYNGVTLKVMQRKELRKYNTVIGYEYELDELTEGALYA